MNTSSPFAKSRWSRVAPVFLERVSAIFGAPLPRRISPSHSHNQIDPLPTTQIPPPPDLAPTPITEDPTSTATYEAIARWRNTVEQHQADVGLPFLNSSTVVADGASAGELAVKLSQAQQSQHMGAPPSLDTATAASTDELENLRSSSSIRSRGSASYTNEEHIPISTRTPESSFPATDGSFATKVDMPSNTDARDRTRTAGLDVLPTYEGLFMEQSAPRQVLAYPDEPHPPNLEYIPYLPGDGMVQTGDNNISVSSRVDVKLEPQSRLIPYGFDTGVSPPPSPRSGSVGNVLMQPPAPNDRVSISPTSEGIPMDCGTMPSRVYPPGQEPSRRQIPSRQAAGRGNVGGGGQMRGWVIPFTDHRTVNSYQQDFGRSPHGVHNISPEFAPHGVSPYLSTSSSSPPGRDPHLQSPANPAHTTPSPVRPSPFPYNRPFHDHGWAEYLLPDESLYYVHQGYQVVTDVDLGDENILNAVVAYLEAHDDVILPSQELWLRDTGSGAEGVFNPLRCLIDHTRQSVVLNFSPEVNDHSGQDCTRRGRGDDRLDAKYRYWTFVETHPAHLSLPLGAHQEAMDSLSWASTNALLSRRSIPTPFTQEECQSLTSLLRSIDRRGETPLRTYTVSKILLRVVCWRQSHFRPDKPLPVDAGRGGLRREDYSTPTRSSGNVFMLTIGVYVCLVIAVILGTSGISVRIAGIGAIFFSLSPVVSNVLALAPTKTDSGFIVGVPHTRSKKVPIVTDSTPALPPWPIQLWQKWISRLYRAQALQHGRATTVADEI